MSEQEQPEEIITPGARAQLGGAFQQPQILQALQDRFSDLEGQRSLYIESLPLNVRNRIQYLQNLSKKNAEIEVEFQREVLALERKFLARHQVLFDKRHQVISGSYEPKDEECARTEEELAEEDWPPAPPVDNSIKGIPEFWLTVLKNVPPLAEHITEEDEKALKHLIDIKAHILEDLSVNFNSLRVMLLSFISVKMNSLRTKSYRKLIMLNLADMEKALITPKVVKLTGKKTRICLYELNQENSAIRLLSKFALSRKPYLARHSLTSLLSPQNLAKRI
jgi:hypothetical protein